MISCDLYRRAVGALALVAGTSVSLAGTLPVTTIALTGTDGPLGPGMGPGVTFTSIGQHQPSINSSGGAAFRAVASNDASQGMWIHAGVANTNVVLGGGAMPGGGTYITGTSVVNSPQINNSGEWAFRMGASTGLFGTNSGTPTRVLLAGDTAPGTGGATYNTSATGMPLFNNAGHIGYIGSLTTGTGSPPVTITAPNANANAIWTGTPGATTLALRQNDAVTSIDPGGTVRVGAFQNLSLTMNGSGRFAVNSALQGSVTTGTGVGSNSAMISSNRSGSLEVIARNGNAAPDATGAPSTDLYRSLGTSAVGFNNAGHVSFISSLRDAAAVQTSTSSLFTDAGSGTLRQVARQGTSLPAIQNANGTEFAGTSWSSFSNQVLTGADDLALTASLTGAPTGWQNVLFTMDSATDTFSKIARSSNATTPGDIAIVGGAPLGGDAYFTSFSSITMNTLGQVVFQATLNGAGIAGGAGGNNSGLFAYVPGTGICLIARTSDLFEVAPGDFRTISSLGGIAQSGGQDGRTQSLSESGLLAFELDFTDGSSGVFVTTIPTPGALALLGVSGLLATRRRRN
ncbi:MAG: hypothetical protein IPK69_07370 [Phycisphaerales bacterium]|nr:MAG: hypothetical protein IPK69_07370 [Phycisphaerales bacterium]